MSALPKDGGPAFAAMGVSPAGDVYHEHGMSMRDWFAGQALAAMIAKHPLIVSDEGETAELSLIRLGMARSAYAYADFMLEARSK